MSDFIVSPSQLTSILSAANLLVSTLAEAPVESLDTGDLNPDVNVALLLLDQADLECQMRKWAWNTDLALKIAPSGSGYVVLPDEVLVATLSEYHQQPSGTSTDVVPRGTRMYDRVGHTYSFSGPVYIDLTSRLSWDLLPQAARSYIAYKACVQFQARMSDRSILFRVTDDMVSSSLAALEHYEDLLAPKDAVKGNPSIRSSLFGQVRRRGV